MSLNVLLTTSNTSAFVCRVFRRRSVDRYALWNWVWDSLFCVHVFHFCFRKSGVHVCDLYNYQYCNKSSEVVNLLLKARSCSQQMINNSHLLQRQTRLEGVAMSLCNFDGHSAIFDAHYMRTLVIICWRQKERNADFQTLPLKLKNAKRIEQEVDTTTTTSGHNPETVPFPSAFSPS